ncbi:MAG: hypothetical protein WCQ00_03100 [bacterium]
MNNELQKAVNTALIVISLSVGYYFIWYLPRQDKRETTEQTRKEEIANIQKCEQIGSERFEKDKKELRDGIMNSEYRFNKETNQCLYKGGYIGSNIVTQYIYDLYTNKEIVSYSADVNGNPIVGRESEFKSQESILFKK